MLPTYNLQVRRQCSAVRFFSVTSFVSRKTLGGTSLRKQTLSRVLVMAYIFVCRFLHSFASFCCLRRPGSVGVDRLGVEAFSGFM